MAQARKGVHVRVYRDREQFEQEAQRGGVTTTGILLAAGVEVRIKGARDLMHLKSYAIDGACCVLAPRFSRRPGSSVRTMMCSTNPARKPWRGSSESLKRSGPG